MHYRLTNAWVCIIPICMIYSQHALCCTSSNLSSCLSENESNPSIFSKIKSAGKDLYKKIIHDKKDTKSTKNSYTKLERSED
ncbi:hypothetical protein NEPAR06_2307 [Nematocida parisii]|uniref:Uncharacterized protein n=1 Tax=Nematocida parisii (strain ERTm3) TaxID=935791 RepID=I3EFC2_NEMP3|nr:uncharacterized protein NEPG_02092 [Nematocida parisii ERTm1]EIJ87919.1 hypothetical protein NEQG_01991 [Nematocida parisii ERTm3]KAI5130982.1 hypothetical protein NEPAR08_2288 [Nematocida parisii]EIJ93136.1 hypothetical protein NEPG_02092 [Nematocida parisii ERTm1]KAI5131145.1 hypothetical protein NEPAR03_2304 [Nematocida parisii]KAI5156881.1 hypothetical protein NEPAR06_2307 [Nematocida parisii]|eukprot:XP_013059919.1 hypothetical protein NEPG_02092 [Nematocida parisii ERTm1]